MTGRGAREEKRPTRGRALRLVLALAAGIAALTLSCGPELGPAPLPAPTDNPATLSPTPSGDSGSSSTAPSAPPTPGVRLAVAATGLAEPVDLLELPDGRLLVAEQAGRLVLLDPRLPDPRPVAIADLGALLARGGEQGLLGIALHPRFGETVSGSTEDRLYLDYTRGEDGATVVAVVGLDLTAATPRLRGAPLPLLLIRQPYANHNGGELLFRDDGLLVIPTGDGGSGGDPEGRAQDPRSLLGKILLLDVAAAEAAAEGTAKQTAGAGGVESNSTPSSPPSSPTVWMSGLRNPWRAVFDSRDGALWVTDVGQATTEEVTRLPADPARDGANLGWRLIEGDRCYGDSACSEPPDYAAPIGVYRHEGGACSISGGALADDPRGGRWFLFTDWCDGRIRAISADLPPGRVADPTATILVLGEGQSEVSGIIADRSGRIWLLDHGRGRLLRLTLK